MKTKSAANQRINSDGKNACGPTGVNYVARWLWESLGRIMKQPQKMTFTEKIIGYSSILLLIFSLGGAIYLNNEIDQLNHAYIVGFKYTYIPFLVLFSVILYRVKKDTKSTAKLAIIYSSLYAVLSVFPILIINNYIGSQSIHELSGTVINKKNGRADYGFSKPSITVASSDQEITLRVPRKLWSRMQVGEEVTINLNKGSLGLYYK